MKQVAFRVVLMVALIVLSPITEAQNVCGTAPLSTTPQGPTTTKVFNRHNGEAFRAKFWRMPCTPADSMLVMTVEATSGSPQICSLDFTLLQGGLQTQAFGIASDAGSNAFCGDILTTLTLAFIPRSTFPASFDMDGELVVDFNGFGSGNAGHQQVTIPPYDPQAYGPPVPHPTRDYTGQWHSPAEVGRGLSMFQFGNTLFAIWFVYDGNGKAAWYQLDPQWVEDDVAAGRVVKWEGPPWGPTYQGDRELIEVGSFTLEFTAGNRASLSYSVDAVTRELMLEKIE